jgi:hypothetical protein
MDGRKRTISFAFTLNYNIQETAVIWKWVQMDSTEQLEETSSSWSGLIWNRISFLPVRDEKQNKTDI